MPKVYLRAFLKAEEADFPPTTNRIQASDCQKVAFTCWHCLTVSNDNKLKHYHYISMECGKHAWYIWCLLMKTSFSFCLCESIQTDIMHDYLQRQRENSANPNKATCYRHDSKLILLPTVNFNKLLKDYNMILNYKETRRVIFRRRIISRAIM